MYQRMGKDRIGSIMKRMAAVADLCGKKTNHSARKTMVTTLTKSKIPETQIIQLTGHKNLQSLTFLRRLLPPFLARVLLKSQV